MPFVINFIGSHSDESGYYAGKTYTHQGEIYAICDGTITNATKKYTSRNRAESAAKKVVSKACNVGRWEVEETK